MDVFRPIQCYSCFSWCQHFKPNCPTKHKPQICSRCSETGHNYYYCTNTPLCLNCQGPHPATARICPEYTKAVEAHLPIIAKQLAHLIINTHTSADKTTGTDVLTAAIQEATNKDEFLITLYQACKETIKKAAYTQTNTSLLYNYYGDPNETHITHSEPHPVDIHANDDTPHYTHSDPDPEPVDNHTNDDTLVYATNDHHEEIHHTSEIAQINQPKDTLSLLTYFINDYTDHQYTLTNNGVEQLDTRDIKNLRTCNLIEPHTNNFTPNLIFFKTVSDPHKTITFLNEYSEISIDPEVIGTIKTNYKSIKLLTPQGIYELTLQDEHKTDNLAIEHLVQWLTSTYSIPLDINT